MCIRDRACTAPDSYRLVGNLSGLADGTRMLLVPAATHKQEKPIGEAVVEDGKFVFEGQLPEPRLLNLQADVYKRQPAPCVP